MAVTHVWTGAWAAMNDVTLVEALPPDCHRDMQRLGLEVLSLSDPPAELPEEERLAVLESRLLVVAGRVERNGEVVHLLAQRLEDFTKLVRKLPTASRDFR